MSRYVKNLDEWYEGFILQQPSIFAGLNDLEDSSYPDLTKPTGTFSRVVWTKAGRQFSITVTKALQQDDYEEVGDTVDIIINTPLLPCSYQAYTYFNKRTAMRETVLRNFAAVSHLKEVHGFGIEWPNDRASSLKSVWLTRGEDFAQNGNMKTLELTGRLQVLEKEKTAGSVVLPLVLDKLFALGWDITDDDTIEYSVYNVSKFAYVLFIQDIKGWNVLVKVNMHADHDILRAKMQFDTDSVRNTQVGWPDQAVSKLQYASGLYLHWSDLKRARDEAFDHATSWGRGLEDLLDAKADTIKDAKVGEFTEYMQVKAVHEEMRRVETLKDAAIANLGLDDAAAVMQWLKLGMQGGRYVDSKTQVIVNTVNGVVLKPLYTNGNMELGYDTGLQGAIVRCAFGACYGFFLAMLKEHVDVKAWKATYKLLETKLNTAFDPKDGISTDYARLQQALSGTDPMRWADCVILSLNGKGKSEKGVYVTQLAAGNVLYADTPIWSRQTWHDLENGWSKMLENAKVQSVWINTASLLHLNDCKTAEDFAELLAWRCISGAFSAYYGGGGGASADDDGDAPTEVRKSKRTGKSKKKAG